MLSIAIINFKNPALLRLCLKSLASVLPEKFEHEIIVVDSASSPATANVVNEEFKNAKLLPFKENIGYTKGVNEAVKKSLGSHLLILNSDIIPVKESIETMYKYMCEKEDVGILGPQLMNFDGSPQESCFRFISPLTIIYRRIGHLPFSKKVLQRFLMKDKDLSEPATVDWLMGSAMMVSKKAIEKVGLMDENLFLYMSDVDWPRRFWECGYKVVYYPDAKMYHYHRRDSKGRFSILDPFFKKETRWHIKDALKYFKKYGIMNPNYGN